MSSTSEKWLKGLNEEQREAAIHDYGPLLILAGAGSGKTTVLVARTGRLIEEGICPARELCVLTFTNKAARELKARVAAKLGPAARGVSAGTFHSFGLSILREHFKEANLTEEFGVLDSGDASSIVKEILRDLNNGGKTAYDGDKILSIISEWREKGRTKALKDDPYEEAVEWLLPRYLKRLEMLGMVDFDSLIIKPYELLKYNPEVAEKIRSKYSQVMVDEFQDTNEMQMRFVRALVDKHKNVSVVGDDDQSIYGWRGACVSNILDFPKTFPGCKVVRLERNYRSTPAILAVANSVIAKNTERHAKVLRSDPQAAHGELPEVVVYDNENDEAETITGEISTLVRMGSPHKEIAVLYRSNSQGALLEAELRRANIPYLMSGGTAFFDRKETRDVLAYLRCAIKPNEVALRRIINTPARGVGDKTVEEIGRYTVDRKIPFAEAAASWRRAGVDDRAGASLEEFFEGLRNLVPTLTSPGKNETDTAGPRLLKFFDEIGYKAHIEKHAGNSMVSAKRWRILEIFSGILDRFIETGGSNADSIRQFVDAMELRDAMDGKKEKEDRVQLLTLHSCKGLEYPVVFMMGIEEDIIPHRVLGTDVSEERRLFYVGVTRAKRRLVMTRAQRRRKYGKWIDSMPSRFLLEIPPELLQERAGPKPVVEEVRKSMVADLFAKLDALDKAATGTRPQVPGYE